MSNIFTIGSDPVEEEYKDYIISFEKDKDYRRFLVNLVSTNYNRHMISLDLCEEIKTGVERYTIHPNGDYAALRNESDIINLIHATINIHPDQVPVIIQQLQSIYDSYLAENIPEA